MSLNNQTILITGAARRLGREFALACARNGANVILHHGHSPEAASQTAAEIEQTGRRAFVFETDLSNPPAVMEMMDRINDQFHLDAVINSAAIFEPLQVGNIGLGDWQNHLNVNLTAPFLISQAFASKMGPGQKGRIVNILDWRALRPGTDHLPYTISKAALAALTRSLAVALAPSIIVNGLALGAILPPSDDTSSQSIVHQVPLARWGEMDEATEALLFLLDGPGYITGEILHVDGGRHLVG